jgi:uncharacterized membrane protein YkvA (DUF1232 family)
LNAGETKMKSSSEITNLPELMTGEAIPEEEERPKRLLPQLFRYFKILRDFVRLLFGLMVDPRVDRKVKIFVGAVLAYVFAPIDFIPELFTGLFGVLDDFVLSAFALDVILNWIDPAIVQSHWRGEADLLPTIQKTIKNAEILVPEAIVKKIQAWIGKHAVQAIVPVPAEPESSAPKKRGRKSKKA